MTDEQRRRVREVADFFLKTRRQSIDRQLGNIAHDTGRGELPNPAALASLREDVGFVKGYAQAVDDVLKLLAGE